GRDAGEAADVARAGGYLAGGGVQRHLEIDDARDDRPADANAGADRRLVGGLVEVDVDQVARVDLAAADAAVGEGDALGDHPQLDVEGRVGLAARVLAGPEHGRRTGWRVDAQRLVADVHPLLGRGRRLRVGERQGTCVGDQRAAVGGRAAGIRVGRDAGVLQDRVPGPFSRPGAPGQLDV